MLTAARQEKMRIVAQSRIFRIHFVFEHPFDPHNIAAAVRSLDAMGFHNIHIISAKAFRLSGQVAKGARKWVRMQQYRSTKEFFDTPAVANGKVLASHVPMDHLPSTSLEQLPIPEHGDLFLLFGNEHEGISQYSKQHADGIFTIPMWGMVESYNLSVSTSLVAWHVRQQWREHQYRYQTDLQQKVLQQWQS